MAMKKTPRTTGTESIQRDLAEEALRESEGWLNLAEAAGGVGTFDWDIENDSAKCSDQYFRLFGLSPKSSVSLQEFLEQVHKDDAERVQEAVEHTLEHDAPYAVDYRVIWPDGSIHWISDRARVVKDDEGRPVRFHGAITDITERKEAAEVLQRALDGLEQQVESYRSVFEAGSEAYVIHDDGIIIEVNPRFEELTGYRSLEVVGESFLKLVAEESRALVAERMGTRPGRPFEIVGLKSDDTRIHLEAVGKDHLHQGRKVRLVALRDITRRKQAEDALRENEQMFRLVALNVAEVLWLLDPSDYRVIFVSPAYEQLWDRSCESLYEDPMSWLSAVHPEDFDHVSAALERQAETGTFDEEFRIARSDGSIRWVWDRGFAVEDESGQVKYVVGLANDITAQKEAEEARHQLREELEVRVEAEMLRGNAYGLTFREFTVLHLVAEGRADKEIASELGISPHTASRHLKNIMKKMSATSRTDAGVRAVREELID